MELQALGYIGIRTPKLDDWATYATRFLGMELVEQTASMLRLRMDDRRQRVVVEAEGEGLAVKFSEIAGVKAVDQSGPNRYRLLAETDVRPQAAAVVVNAGGALRRLSIAEPSLNAIYEHYFQTHGGHHAAA